MVATLLLSLLISAQSFAPPFNPSRPFGLNENATSVNLGVHRPMPEDDYLEVAGLKLFNDSRLRQCGGMVWQMKSGDMAVAVRGKLVMIIITDFDSLDISYEEVSLIPDKYDFDIITFDDHGYKSSSLRIIFSPKKWDALSDCIWTHHK